MTDKTQAKEPRLMPDPFYVGSAMATTICHIMARDSDPSPLRDGERQLGRFVLPPFQRPPVWNPEQKAKLIESIWLELPIGIYIYNEGPYGHRTDNWLIDGQQRVTAILEYMADEFPVFGYRYSELGRAEHRSFEFGKSFPCVKLSMTDEGRMRDIYMRLAYGGTPHDPL